MGRSLNSYDSAHFYPDWENNALYGLHALKVLHVSKSIPEIAHEHLWNQLKKYLIVGGLPEAVATYQQHKFEALKG